jgi:hypothetical protein
MCPVSSAGPELESLVRHSGNRAQCQFSQKVPDDCWADLSKGHSTNERLTLDTDTKVQLFSDIYLISSPHPLDLLFNLRSYAFLPVVQFN